MNYDRRVWRLTSKDILFFGMDPVVFFLVPIALVANSWNIFYLAVAILIVGMVMKNIFYISNLLMVRRIKMIVSVYFFGRAVT